MKVLVRDGQYPVVDYGRSWYNCRHEHVIARAKGINTMNDGQNEQIKSGMATLVGPPNVGKSTLLNALLGQKISIVTAKPQTTRNRVLGIVNGPGHQIVFIDTPGLHHSDAPLNREMIRLAAETLNEVDVIVFMVDAASPRPRQEKIARAYLAGIKPPALLLINKIDLVAKEQVLPLIAAYGKLHDFRAIIPVSALKNDGTDILLREIITLLPPGPRYYPEDIPTDATERFIVEEIIREKVFMLTGQEIPYSTAVVVDSFKENERKRLTTIHATVFIEKKSQKGIIIGKGGAKLTRIGTAAREDIEKLLGCKVLLKLWVKIRKNWTKDPRFLKELGF